MAETALHGVRVLEVGGGVAGAYCGKLFADMGAHVARAAAFDGDAELKAPLDPAAPETKGLYERYLNAGKAAVTAYDGYDLVILGEEANRDISPEPPKVATLDISWFGSDGPYAGWKGGDLIVQALTGMSHVAGPVEGPPLFIGEHHAALTGGAAAYAAGVGALIGGIPEEPAHFDVSIFESVMIMSEMQMCHTISLATPLRRMGVNRFLPTCPLSIHKCKTGWIGITPLTPAQWRDFCDMLGLPEMGADPDLVPSRTRYPFADRIEAAFDQMFPLKTAEAWAEIGRARKVPMVVVPDAQGILDHPAFNARGTLATVNAGKARMRVPRTPFSLEATPPRADLDVAPETVPAAAALSPAADATSPLADLTVIDFSMGWAGPLATRMLADLGAEVIKIEAGRYPDWWRSVDWAPEAIARGQYEESRHFSVINRGKASVSLDLTQPEGLRLAKELVRAADIVVENQAAGVMSRLGLGYEHLSEGRDDLIMLSMSAFGAGNVWSDTRAYGSVLEQGSGVPHFCGEPDWPPAMGHIAYGDPIGGLYGGAALLSAIYHRRRTGRGQWINNTQIEAMLPFTAAALLVRQATGREPVRRGNRHSRLAPHGVYPAAGDDAWLAIACGDAAWPALAEVIGLADIAGYSAAARRAKADEIDAAISTWSRDRDPAEAAAKLQTLGIAAAPVRPMEDVEPDPHFAARDFFYEIERAHIGHQRQAGLPFRRNGARYPMRGLAPFLGGDSADVLGRLAGVDEAGFARLLDSGVVSFAPTVLRGN